jgi:hypothetical protein
MNLTTSFSMMLALLSPLKRGHHPQFLENISAPALSHSFIYPKNAVIPFNQWQANDGYCGEVSLLQAGLNQGQWMSEFNARLICGTGLSQSGPDGYCEAHHNIPNYNAQILLENERPGDSPFASADLCLANARLAHQVFDYSKQAPGMAGYEQYLSWVKAEVIAGHQVAIAVLNNGGDDPQYDHEVSVTKIGTNHLPTDATYYADDVLFFDDHSTGGTPYTQGFTFGSLAKSRDGANSITAHMYSILIPGQTPIQSSAGGDGSNVNPRPITAANYGFSVSGRADDDAETLPVRLTITQSSVGNVPNQELPVDGFNFENPEIAGTNEDGCTNQPPASWMNITLLATVSQLNPGAVYNLYEYDFAQVSGVGSAAALAVPENNFNAQKFLATKTTSFVATQTTFAQSIETTSDHVIVFRCVEATAP